MILNKISLKSEYSKTEYYIIGNITTFLSNITTFKNSNILCNAESFNKSTTLSNETTKILKSI